MNVFSFLDGYKTILGAIGLVASGVTVIVTALASDIIDTAKIAEGAGLVSTGLAALGIRFAKN